MGNSFKLFSVRGIDIRVHVTFPLILIWSALQFGLSSSGGTSGAAFGVLATLLLFIIVVMHELGHSLAAQHYGVAVKQIVLLPIGGVAQLARIPEKPIQEFVIAIAGPLVNFVLAIALTIVGLWIGVRVGLEAMISAVGGFSLLGLFGYIFTSNLFLGLFNLLPAFPMDGGRVLRAVMAMKLDYARATSIAVTVGQILAWLLGLWGFLQGNFFLIVIAIFIYMGAGHEGQTVQLRNALGGLSVDQAYSRDLEVLRPNSTLRDAVVLTLKTYQADFPVCDGENLVGILTHSRLVDALNRNGPDTPLEGVMIADFTPVTPEAALFDAQQHLLEERLDALPVVDGSGRFLGLITTRDINEAYRVVSTRSDILPLAAARTD
jgi:Zn-dependent protease/CBS domain-containing protein